MDYSIDPAAYQQAFPVPALVADRLLKLATHSQLKVLLYVMRNSACGIDPHDVARACGISEDEACDALDYWVQNGILSSSEKSKSEPEHRENSSGQISLGAKPSRLDVAERGLCDPKIRMLLTEAQLKFGRNLKSNESRTLVWIYDDLGLDVSVILLLLQYALSEGRCNISFIEKTALSWTDCGINSIISAEEWISKRTSANLAWKRVCSAFGIEYRRPSEKELSLSQTWLSEWELDDSLLRLAYDYCVDSKSKFSFAYTAKIIEKWHKNGFKTADDVKNSGTDEKAGQGSNPSERKYKFAAYDLEAFERKLDSDD